jgi:hypothetical protein
MTSSIRMPNKTNMTRMIQTDNHNNWSAESLDWKEKMSVSKGKSINFNEDFNESINACVK